MVLVADAETRGILYPSGLPTFARRPPSASAAALVRWFWFSRWDVPAGQTSRQELLPFPALNLVVEDSCVGVSGASTARSHRDLVGRGWAVGALLWPAATPAVTANPPEVLDRYVLLPQPELHAAVTQCMAGHPTGPLRPRFDTDGAYSASTSAADEAASGVVERWLLERIPAPGEEALLANELVALIDRDPQIRKVEDVARAMSLSVRTVQRLTRRYVGLPPLAMIRRRRLQDAAALVREDPGRSLAGLAADLGYADQAHLIREFREVVGFTPGTYRRSVD